ncbi:hypothetical protein GCM10027589_14560 [Actinocorallia lasiicapitis]
MVAALAAGGLFQAPARAAEVVSADYLCDSGGSVEVPGQGPVPLAFKAKLSTNVPQGVEASDDLTAYQASFQIESPQIPGLVLERGTADLGYGTTPDGQTQIPHRIALTSDGVVRPPGATGLTLSGGLQADDLRTYQRARLSASLIGLYLTVHTDTVSSATLQLPCKPVGAAGVYFADFSVLRLCPASAPADGNVPFTGTIGSSTQPSQPDIPISGTWPFGAQECGETQSTAPPIFGTSTVDLKLFGFVPLTAELTFTASNTSTWTRLGQFAATTSLSTKVSAVTFLGIPIAGGDTCASAPSATTLTGSLNGQVKGTYQRRPLTNCGPLTSLIDPMLATNPAVVLTFKPTT